MPHVVLMSDFGTEDGYFSAMRGVILSHDAALVVHDGPHSIAAHSVHSASYVLHTVLSVYPPGTVFVCVVDPGVGSARKELIADIDGRIVVCPDNGLITLPAHMAGESRFYRASPRTVSEIRSNNRFSAATFDGRDLFSPIAARIASSGLHSVAEALESGDENVPQFVTGLVPVRAWQPGTARSPCTGAAIHIDHFGNVITNIHVGPAQISRPTVRVGGQAYPFGSTFSDVEVGQPVAYAGSYGFLEIAVREGQAARDLGIGVGESVRFETE